MRGDRGCAHGNRSGASGGDDGHCAVGDGNARGASAAGALGGWVIEGIESGGDCRGINATLNTQHSTLNIEVKEMSRGFPYSAFCTLHSAFPSTLSVEC